jgi:aminoglycoside phosphotransferase (APT) family kinase protein
VHDLSIAARDLGGFLHALGRIDAAGGPAAGRANSGRGVSLALLDKRVRNDVASLGDEVDETAVLAAWDQALAAPLHVGAGAWVHGDLHPGNLLIRDGRIVGVLDFGLMGVGDPACDLFVAWNFLDAASRKVFREVVEADEAAWLRGRGWAIFSAIIALAFYLRTNPTLCDISRRTLTEVLG